MREPVFLGPVRVAELGAFTQWVVLLKDETNIEFWMLLLDGFHLASVLPGEVPLGLDVDLASVGVGQDEVGDVDLGNGIGKLLGLVTDVVTTGSL